MKRTYDPEAQEGSIGHPPIAFGYLWIPLFPVGMGCPSGCGTKVFRVIIPGAAPYHVGIKLVGLGPGIFFDCTFFCWIGGEVAVQGPFGHVAMHIVKSPRVGIFCAYFLVSPIAVFKIPSILSQHCGVVSKRIGGGSSCPAGVF